MFSGSKRSVVVLNSRIRYYFFLIWILLVNQHYHQICYHMYIKLRIRIKIFRIWALIERNTISVCSLSWAQDALSRRMVLFFCYSLVQEVQYSRCFFQLYSFRILQPCRGLYIVPISPQPCLKYIFVFPPTSIGKYLSLMHPSLYFFHLLHLFHPG